MVWGTQNAWADEDDKKVEPEAEPEAEQPAEPKAYVPPSRLGMGSAVRAGGNVDTQNEALFPSLGDAANVKTSKKKKKATMSLADFQTGGYQARTRPNDDQILASLPKGPSGEPEPEGPGLGGAFNQGYGGDRYGGDRYGGGGGGGRYGERMERGYGGGGYGDRGGGYGDRGGGYGDRGGGYGDRGGGYGDRGGGYERQGFSDYQAGGGGGYGDRGGGYDRGPGFSGYAERGGGYGNDRGPRQGGFGEGGYEDMGGYDEGPSRADTSDNWGKDRPARPAPGPRDEGRGGFGGRGGGFREGGFEDAYGYGEDREFLGPSRADEADDWGKGKKFVPTPEHERQALISQADTSDDWSKNKQPLPSTGRDGYQERPPIGGADEPGQWKRGQGIPGNVAPPPPGNRPKLELKARTTPVEGSEAAQDAVYANKASPFGSARPVAVKDTDPAKEGTSPRPGPGGPPEAGAAPVRERPTERPRLALSKPKAKTEAELEQASAYQGKASPFGGATPVEVKEVQDPEPAKKEAKKKPKDGDNAPKDGEGNGAPEAEELADKVKAAEIKA